MTAYGGKPNNHSWGWLTLVNPILDKHPQVTISMDGIHYIIPGVKFMAVRVFHIHILGEKNLSLSLYIYIHEMSQICTSSRPPMENSI